MKKKINEFVKFDPQTNELICKGEWTLINLKVLKKQVNKIVRPEREVIVNAKHLTKMDSAGAWLMSSWLRQSDQKRKKIQLKDFTEQHQKLLSFVEDEALTETNIPPKKSPTWLAKIGKSALSQFIELREFLNFIGGLTAEALRLILHPKHFRWAALTNVIDSAGLRALPIIALLSFMIGVVIAYQMATQLRNYGANIFIVDFLGLSVLREFGGLLTAIIVAGRTGSAFTAQLGTMKINQEIDALNTLGVTPAELLLIPRILGLFIALPLLTMWADIFGILGGMLMSENMLGITPYDFLVRFHHVIPLRTFLIGLGKAPVFALLIASIGCFEGMRVHGSADSVGKQTTRSVVLSIFFIIIVDAIFSVIFSKMKL
jgi:phospholipid/cholesterol/gamma-HCH transport system permease protein